MEIKNCKLKNPIKSCFYDGSKKSAEFIENNFSDFEFFNARSRYLIYFCSDGEYQNTVPPNVHIVQFRVCNGHLIHTDWFTPEEFQKYFEEIEKPTEDEIWSAGNNIALRKYGYTAKENEIFSCGFLECVQWIATLEQANNPQIPNET